MEEEGEKSIISRIKKRDGRIVLFDQERITNAIFKAAQAVGGKDRKLAKKLSDEVVNTLEKRFGSDIVPTVEQIQDIVEKVLIENGHAKTAKAYILYREQRRKVREIQILLNSIEIIDNYVSQLDWRVKENSNMGYSLQGLNNHISTTIVSKYWLNKLYPDYIREAHENARIHLHDLGTLGAYCVGWDLKDLLMTGFRGVPGKTESKSPKHFRTALGQIVNFFYTLQGETAGAQAFSNFDTLLAPFIHYDRLNHKGIKQAMQEFIFNMNVPTRVGFQCLSEDTEILTVEGWKKYDEIKKGMQIKTFNLKKGLIEDKKVKNIFKKKYKGIMYNLKNRIQDQLISPKHRVIRKKFQTEKYILEPIEDIIKLKSPFITLVAAKNSKKDIAISDDQIKLMAWIIGEGSTERSGKHRCCYRVSIYQSAIKNKRNYEEIKRLLKHFKLKYSEYTQQGLGSPVQRLRLNAKSSRKVHKWLSKENVSFIPPILLNMSQRQSQLFIETYMKAEGFEGCKIATSSITILNDLQAIASNAGYGSTILERKPTIGTKTIYVLRLIKHGDTYINKIAKVKYSGIIWCPNTKNETVIARRNGKVFITGNTPFTNLTFDLKVPDFMKDENVIIGGKVMSKKYKDFQEEMDWLNDIFAEIMMTGDAKNRVFTFPIPTYNITKSFDWDNPAYDKLWEMTARFGIPYFSNFIHSDMKPEDAKSMCCRLRLDQRELKKRGGGLFGAHPLTGSIGVVTINMAQIGHLSKNETEFFEKLEEIMKIAKDSLEIKRKILERFTDLELYPYTKFYLRRIKEGYGQYWKNHFSTIGLNGMNEALLNLINTNIASEEGKKFTIKILDFMRGKISKYQEETGNLYNLEATPAEGTSYRLAKIDKKLYPEIIVANEKAWRERKAAPYYTNSTQLPVDHTEDIFEALALQDGIQTLYTGGCIEKGNKVLTDKGLFDIEYIVKNFKKLKPIKAISYNPEKKISEWDEITDAVAIAVYKKNKIRIKAERNLDIVTSDWHPFFLLEKIKVNPHCPICGKKVKNSKAFSVHLRFYPKCRKTYKVTPKYEVTEKRADKLKVKDYILQNSYNLHPEQERELNDDLIWLIGFFISDGCISEFIDNRGGNNLKRYVVRFATEYSEVLEKTKDILLKYFDSNVKIQNRDKRSKKLKEVATSKKEISEFLFKYGFKSGKKVYDINIPKRVKDNITKTNLFALLAGLIDGDGHISKRDGDIEYYTVSQKLAEDILEVCTKGGIMISKYEKPTKRKNEVNGYRLRIPAYQATKIKNKLTISVNSIKINRILSDRKKRHFPVVRVKKLSKIDVEDNKFYDLTTKNNHNYLAGKNTFVFIHNTVLHGFLGEKVSSIEATKQLVRKIAENFRIPYYTLTPTFSVCPIHGYLPGEHEYCPKCDEEIGYKGGEKEEWKQKTEPDVKSTAESLVT